jgi:hypothetical protein
MEDFPNETMQRFHSLFLGRDSSQEVSCPLWFFFMDC